MAQNPSPSQLDPGQIIKRSFDETNDRLRVDATVTATFTGAQEVVISQTDDTIQIYGTDGATNRAIKTDSSGNLQTNVLSSALPAGAATAAKQDTGNTSLASLDSKTTVVNTGAVTISTALPAGANTLGKVDQGVGGASAWKVDGSAVTQPISGSVSVSNFPSSQNVVVTSIPEVEIKNDSGSPIPVNGTVAATQSGTWNINNVSGTISLPTGASTEATLAKLTQTQGSTTSGQSGPLVQGAVTTSSPTYTTAQTSPLSLTTGGALRVDASATTQPVSGTVSVTPTLASTSVVSSVAGSASNVSLLSSNSGRLGASFFNDSSATLYLKLGTTASTSSHTVQIVSKAFYEVPVPVYRGEIDGIWDSATGAVRITEIT